MKLNKILIISAFLVFHNYSCPAFPNDGEHYLIKGNEFYQTYLKTQNKQDLENAHLSYYRASQIAPSASSFLGLGIVFLEKDMLPQAKKYLYKAYSIDEDDPATNYYLGCFRFDNEEYVRALDFLKKACEYGLSENYDVNLKMAIIYEKVGDFELAKEYYQKAQKLNPNDEFLNFKLYNLDELEANKIKYFNDWD